MTRFSRRPALAGYLAVLAIAGATFTASLAYLGSTVRATVVQASAVTAPSTRLDELIANGREIRNALAVPIPLPEPLAPLTAKPARLSGLTSASPVRNRKAASDARDVSSRIKNLSAQARDAFAAAPRNGPPKNGPNVSFDRHNPL